MNGLIMQNTLLKQVEAEVEKKVRPIHREAYMKIVVSGMKFAMDKGPQGILASLKQSKDPLTDCVKGAISIVGLLRRAAKGKMPIGAVIPAAMTLMLQALDFADKMGLLKVRAAEIDKATKLFVETLLPLMNVPPEQVAQMTEQVHTIMRDPDKMQQIKEFQNGNT